MLGYFLVSGRRSRADSSRKVSNDLRGLVGRVLRRDAGGSTEAETAGHASSPDSQSVRNTATVETSNESSQSVTSEPDDDNPLSVANLKHQLQQITRGQWIIAAAVLIAVPLVAYIGTFFIYPFVEDLIEGESPIAAVLAEYGVDEGAETQLLTIRRGDLVNSVSVNGTLEYANRERLSFGTSGTIDTIDVEVGDFVSEGEVLMSLNDEAAVAAQQQLQNTSVALQDAEDELQQLIDPDDKAVGDATLKVVKAGETLADAEDALAAIIQPAKSDIANAELAVATAAADLETAQEKLSDLLSPTDVDLGNAQLAVAEAEKTLADLKAELTDLTAEQSAAISAAEIAVGEAIKVRDDAREAYEDTLDIDEAAVNQAQLDLEEAKLALIEAKIAASDAENSLLVAQANVANDITRKKLEISKVEAELAAATLDLTDAQDALSDAQKPFDEEVVADLNAQIAEARNDVIVAENQLARLEIEIGADVRKLESELYDARSTYQNVFFKWLGMDISKYQWEYSPDQIFADVGKTLSEIMDPATVAGGLGQRTSASSGWVKDDPETPWDETVVATWTEFFLTQLQFDCTESGTGVNSECVNLEFDDAWDDLLLKSEAYQTTMLADSQQFDNAEDAVESAKKSLEDLQEQLEDALTGTDDDTISDLFAKQEVANYTQVDTKNRLELLFEELERVEQESEARVVEASQSLAVATEAAKVARNNLTDAEETLAEVKTVPDDVTITVAYFQTTKAEADLAEAVRASDNLHNLESPDNVVMHRRIYAAEADLDDKTRVLQTLLSGDDNEIVVARSEVAAAQEDLNDKIVALQDLISPDEVDIELARQELAVARADLTVASQEHAELVNPDPGNRRPPTRRGRHCTRRTRNRHRRNRRNPDHRPLRRRRSRNPGRRGPIRQQGRRRRRHRRPLDRRNLRHRRRGRCPFPTGRRLRLYRTRSPRRRSPDRKHQRHRSLRRIQPRRCHIPRNHPNRATCRHPTARRSQRRRRSRHPRTIQPAPCPHTSPLRLGERSDPAHPHIRRHASAPQRNPRHLRRLLDRHRRRGSWGRRDHPDDRRRFRHQPVRRFPSGRRFRRRPQTVVHCQNRTIVSTQTYASQPVIRIRDVTKVYDMGAGTIQVRALDGVSIDIRDGEYVAIMGASGSGKSTLMNIIGCLDIPTTGSYHIDGRAVESMSNDHLADIRSRKVGFVFQTHNLLPRLTALANVELPMMYGHWPNRRKRAENALTLVGLADRTHHRPTELSGGQQQRVGIARALVKEPSVLLADEPTGNLDTSNSAEILNIISDLNHENGITVIVVTHEPDVAARADRVITLSDGRVISDET